MLTCREGKNEEPSEQAVKPMALHSSRCSTGDKAWAVAIPNND